MKIPYISEGPREDLSDAEVPSPTAGPTSLSELQTLRTCQYSTLSLPPWAVREKQRMPRLQAVISEPIPCLYLSMLSVFLSVLTKNSTRIGMKVKQNNTFKMPIGP